MRAFEHCCEQCTADDAQPPGVHVVAAGQQDRAGDGDVGSQLQLEVRVGQVHRPIVMDPRPAGRARHEKGKAPLARGPPCPASGERLDQNLYWNEAASTSPRTLYLPASELP
ncbi:hypothetical protein G6F24_015918 [Rhizopus arrhizus]|nr:hypothetical protein G6F24_015918 [Rhizopus arrhizus]